LQHQDEKLIGKQLLQAFLSKEQEKRMVPAERILIKENWMDFSLKLVIFVDGVLFSFFHFFFVDNFLVV